MSRDASVQKKELSLTSFILIVAAIVIPIRLFVAKPFIVSGTSMSPTFESWHYLIIDQLTYRLVREPQRGDVVVMKYPLDTSRYFIKRVVGVPGDTVILNGTSVTIKNKLKPEGVALAEPYVAELNKSESEMITELQEGEYYALGDNRAASADSRVWGVLPRKDIVGRAFVRLFPFTQIEYLPGAFAHHD
jgi:signal peptidase I